MTMSMLSFLRRLRGRPRSEDGTSTDFRGEATLPSYSGDRMPGLGNLLAKETAEADLHEQDPNHVER